MTSIVKKTALRPWIASFGLVAVLLGSGCQSTYNGQSLPSPEYLKHEIFYAAEGTEFLLSKEAAALKAKKAELISTPQQ